MSYHHESKHRFEVVLPHENGDEDEDEDGDEDEIEVENEVEDVKIEVI
jgi:hypothetical protein